MYDVRPILEGLPEEFGAAAAREAGISPKVLARLVRLGRLSRIDHGLFRQVAIGRPQVERWDQLRAEHLARLRAALLLHPHHAASHISAAVLRGWPVRLHPETLVHLTAITVQPRSRRAGDRFLHHSDSMRNDVEPIDGLSALGAARTVADCLRIMRPPAGVAVADAALRDGSVCRQEVQEVLDAQHRWVGRPKARRSLLLTDPRRESWLESFSFATLAGLGLDLPAPQVEVYTASGALVGRVDGMWIDDGTVGEADGAGKYLIPATTRAAEEPTGPSAARRVVAERKRERALLDLGLQVVRWDTEEILRDPEAVAHRVLDARTTGSLHRFRGRLRVDGAWLPAPSRRPHPSSR